MRRTRYKKGIRVVWQLLMILFLLGLIVTGCGRRADAPGDAGQLPAAGSASVTASEAASSAGHDSGGSSGDGVFEAGSDDADEAQLSDETDVVPDDVSGDSDADSAIVSAEDSSGAQNGSANRDSEQQDAGLNEADAGDAVNSADEVAENGSYTSKEEVALYLHLYGHLPGNYITKKEAEKLGWDSHAGNLQDVAPGKSIGGSRFGNYEGLLPDAAGRTYYECDINYDGGYRGAERIIYSDDGLIFYTNDHYKSFEQLY